MDDLAFDVELHEANDSQEIIKCGAVQLNLEKLSFSFTCVYCDFELDSLRAFALHFQQHLLLTEAENEIVLNNVGDDDNPQDMDESSSSLHGNSTTPNDDEIPRDYQIEMIDDSAQDNIEMLDSSADTEVLQYVYRLRVLNKPKGKPNLKKSGQTKNNEINQSDNDETPALHVDFDIVHEETLKTKKDTNNVCEICGMKFTEASTLETHLQRHIRCQLCHTHFTTKAQLKEHIKDTHDPGKKEFVCEECGQGFKDLENLETHQRSHVTKKFYLCNTCGKSFDDESSLRSHIRIHTRARPFICKECNMTFSRREALVLHARMHSDIRKFSCTICRMTFAQNSGLLMHMKEKHHTALDTKGIVENM